MRIPVSLVLLLLVLVEITGFILVGEAIGIAATLGLTLLGMIAGATLLRAQGVATLMRVRAEIEAGRTPARSIANGAILALAALLIILPGFLTDAFGLLLFVPAIREALWQMLLGRIEVATAAPAQKSAQGPVVELDSSEYGARPHGDSPWRQEGGPEA